MKKEFYVAALGGELQDLRSAAGPYPSLDRALAGRGRVKFFRGQTAPREPTSIGSFFACQVVGPAGLNTVLGPFGTEVEAHRGILREIYDGGDVTFSVRHKAPIFVAVARCVMAADPSRPGPELAVLERLG